MPECLGQDDQGDVANHIPVINQINDTRCVVVEPCPRGMPKVTVRRQREVMRKSGRNV